VSEPKADLTKRERVAVYLIIWAVKIISPWEYDHQQKDWIAELKAMLK